MAKRERNSRPRWLWGVILLTVLVTSLPYFLAYTREGTDWVFTGFVFGVEDGNSYIAKMLSGAAGEWLFRTPYTTLPQKGFLAFLPYILLGKLAGGGAIHIQLVALFHLFRTAGIILFLLAGYDFCRLFFSDEGRLRWAVLLVTFGGGLGWLSLLGVKTGGYESLPLEFYSPESFGFLGVFGLPHLAVARALLLWGLAGFLTRPQGKPFLHGCTTGLYWLSLGFMQPLTIVSGWAVIAAGLAVNWIRLRFNKPDRETLRLETRAWRERLSIATGMGLVSSPMVLYNFLSFSLDPFLKGWSQQNLILSPPPADYLLAYGLVLPFAILGAIKAVRSGDWIWSVPLGWVAIFPLLAYFPYPLQRRLPEGVWVAWILLALLGVDALRKKWRGPALIVLSSGFLSTVLFFSGSLWAISTPAEPLFQPQAKIAAYTYLAEAEEPFSQGLSAYSTGNSLPAWAPVRVVIGHGPESVNLADLEAKTAGFFSEDTEDAARIDFLRDQRVRFVFYGPDERALGEWNPENSSYLSEIYSQDGYTIYRVQLPE